jgi:AcrR family transcriptional regulator
MAATVATPRVSARERLLAAADELFYAEGVHTVGIDRIIEQAGVAKATLYNNFGSKEELVKAYLESRHIGMAEKITRLVERQDTPRERLLAVFDAVGELFEQPGFRGCAFVSATAEAPAGGLIEQASRENRTWVNALFADLAEQAGAADPRGLARQLHLLYDGASLAANLDHDPAAAVYARNAAAALLDAATAPEVAGAPREESAAL